MYTYTAGATGLDAAMPLWVQAGGREAWIARLRDPAIRARVAAEMRAAGAGLGESLSTAPAPDGMLLAEFRNPALRRYVGKTLAEVARERGTSPEETAMDLVVEDGSRVGTIYFLMSEDNVRRQVRLPWMSFGSDAGSVATEGAVPQRPTRIRAPMAISRGCSAAMCATSGWCRCRRRCGG